MFQLHIGPSSSKSLTFSKVAEMVLAKGGGNCSTGVLGLSGAVRSMISIGPVAKAAPSAERAVIVLSNLGRCAGIGEPRCVSELQPNNDREVRMGV